MDRPMTLFASRTIGQHLLRGLVGGIAFVIAVPLFFLGEGWLAMTGAAVFGVVAVLALRGCPLCWTVGLVETVIHRLGGRTPRNFYCEIRAATPRRDR
jgi:hypothetical protein